MSVQPPADPQYTCLIFGRKCVPTGDQNPDGSQHFDSSLNDPQPWTSTTGPFRAAIADVPGVSYALAESWTTNADGTPAKVQITVSSPINPQLLLSFPGITAVQVAPQL